MLKTVFIFFEYERLDGMIIGKHLLVPVRSDVPISAATLTVIIEGARQGLIVDGEMDPPGFFVVKSLSVIIDADTLPVPDDLFSLSHHQALVEALEAY